MQDFKQSLLVNGTSLTHSESVACVAGTLGLFVALNLIADSLLKAASGSLRANENFWRFKNTFLSWIHSIVASVLVVLNVYHQPMLFDDMMFVRTRFAQFSICVSVGYFIYDAIDMVYMSNKKLKSQSYEILLHHVIIVITFSIPLYTGLYVGYTVAGLSIEFNTIFLHLRFMLAFQEFDKSQLPYKLVAKTNIITFIVFRILILCWMTRWIVLNRQAIPLKFFALASFGLAVMLIINIVLLDRLITSDFRKKQDKSSSCKKSLAASTAESLNQTLANTLATHGKFE